MSDIEQMADNLSYMKDFKPLNSDEQEIIRKAQRILGNSSAIPCTACRYCVPGCPKRIPIPEIFTAANLQLGNGQIDDAIESYKKAVSDGRRASDCIACRQCERACPQQLKIVDYLGKCAKMLEK